MTQEHRCVMSRQNNTVEGNRFELCYILELIWDAGKNSIHNATKKKFH